MPIWSSRTVFLVVVCALTLSACAQKRRLNRQQAAAMAPAYWAPSSQISEKDRSDNRHVVVLPDLRPVSEALLRTYRKATPGILDSAAYVVEPTVRMAAKLAVESPLGELVSTRFLLPFVIIPFAATGAATAKAQQEIQEFRDALTKDLVEVSGQSLSSEFLAMQVYSRLATVPDVDAKILATATPIPPVTDAVLEVRIADFILDVGASEALITLWVDVQLTRRSDGHILFADAYAYQDRDTLRNWTRDDMALWHDFVNFSNHYFARVITERLYEVRQSPLTVAPVATESVHGITEEDWSGITDSRQPTLGWSQSPGKTTAMRLPGTYEIEIYDNDRLVHAARNVAGESYRVTEPLEPCKVYRWAVRSARKGPYGVRFTNWTRYPVRMFPGNYRVGSKASKAPAYTADFASLEVACDAS